MKNLIHKILKEEGEKKNIFIPHNIESRKSEKEKRDADNIEKCKQEFKELLSKSYKMKPYLNGVEFYNENGDWLFNYDLKINTFWIDYDIIWSVFMDKYSLNTQQIRDLTTATLRDVFNLQGVTTRRRLWHF